MSSVDYCSPDSKFNDIDDIVRNAKAEILKQKTSKERAAIFQIIIQKLIDNISSINKEYERNEACIKVGLLPYNSSMMLVNLQSLRSLTNTLSTTKNYFNIIGCKPVKNQKPDVKNFKINLNIYDQRKWVLYTKGPLVFEKDEVLSLTRILNNTRPKLCNNYVLRTYA